MTKRTVIPSIFNIFNVLFITAFLSKISLGIDAPEPVIPAVIGAGHIYQMGIEIETSAIKIKGDAEDKLQIDFSNRDRGLIWRLEEDTSDASLGDDFYNLEAKTSPARGFNYEEINDVATDVEAILESLYRESQRASLTVNERFLNRYLRDKYQIQIPYSRFCCLRCCSKFSVKANTSTRDIRPQITYQLPLQDMPRVFERLATLGHKGIRSFFNALTHPHLVGDIAVPREAKADEGEEKKHAEVAEEKKDDDITAKRRETPLAFNVKKEKQMLKFIREEIAPRFMAMGENTPVKGFIVLFLYYWYELFNGKKIVPPLEVGLKKYLGIMSRIPFSQMYDHMDVENQTAFREFLTPLLDFASNFHLRAYDGYRGRVFSPDSDDDEAISIVHWFNSITNPANRVGRRDVDLLSPPQYLQGHSMGAKNIGDANGFALIEVRGYSTLKYRGSNSEISSVRELVRRESNWFFRREAGDVE